jgi:hypothetical protein
MKNVTITLDEAVAQWARVEAAKAGKSLSRWIGERLTTEMRKPTPATPEQMAALMAVLDGPGFPGFAGDSSSGSDGAYLKAAEAFLDAARLAAAPGIAANLPNRDEIYDRPALRRHQSADLLPRPKRSRKAR